MYTDGDHAPSYLVSPELTLPQGRLHCLTFWYYVYGLPGKDKCTIRLTKDFEFFMDHIIASIFSKLTICIPNASF